jgi:hypothetical protein
MFRRRGEERGGEERGVIAATHLVHELVSVSHFG